MNFWQLYLLNWQGLRPVWVIFVSSFVYKGLLVWAFPQLHRLKFTCCWKSQILPFCFLLVWLIKLKMSPPPPISQLGLFQGIICNTERLKGVTLNPWITGGPKMLRRPWFKRGDLRPFFIPWLYLAWDQDNRP